MGTAPSAPNDPSGPAAPAAAAAPSAAAAASAPGVAADEPNARWTRLDAGIALALATANVLAHLPFRSRHLATWDSVLFALGMHRFSVPEARPHPPGYPVYIAMARLARPAFADENATLVALSLALAGAAVALTYVVARRLLPRWPAAVAAFLFGLSPVLAHNAVLATSYAGEAMFAVAVAWAAWHARRNPGARSAAVLGATFLLALGFRQSLLFFLTPLVAWALLAPPRARTDGAPMGARLPELVCRGAAFAAAALVVGLAWLVPLLVTSGGWRSYTAATSLQTRLVVFADTVFTDGRAAWDDHWTRLMLYLEPETTHVLPVAVALAGGAVLALAVARRPFAWPAMLPRDGWAFLAWWSLPALAFYLLVFNGWDRGPDGYALVLLPPLYIAFAALGSAALAALRGTLRPGTVAGRAGALLPLLLLVPAPGLALGWQEPMADVREHDRWTEAWQRLEADFPANDTAIVASYSWAHVKWFFPEHTLWSRLHIPPGPDWEEPWVLTIQTRHREDDVSFYEAHLRGPVPTAHPIPDGIRRVVLFDFQLAGEQGEQRTVAPGVDVREATLGNGWRVLYFETDEERRTIEEYFVDPATGPQR